MDESTSPLTPAEILDLHPLLPLAWGAASAAGAFLRDDRPSELVVDSKSSPTDAVTEMDRNAERMIVDTILAERPDDGILGEEGGQRVSTSGVRWVIDPLDGTVNYLYRLPMWGVSVAAQDADGTVVGVVVAPALEEAYVGVRGVGSWRVTGSTVTRLQVSECTELATALISTGFSYDSTRRTRQAHALSQIIASIRDVRRTGTAVLDLSWVASGRLDGYFERGINPWDYAAGALIATEAGAEVTALRDDNLDEIVVAAAPGIAAPLRTLLLSVDADLA